MNNLKKYTALVTALVLAASVTGCGKKEKTASPVKEEVGVNVTVVEV